MILRDLGLIRVIISCIVTLASSHALVGGWHSFKDGKVSSYEKTSVNSFHSAPDGIDSQVDGCMAGKEILRVGEYRQAGCGRLECISSNTTVELLFISCGLPPSDDVKDGCTLLPQTVFEFPKCCERIYVCEQIKVVEVPVYYPASNISDLKEHVDTQYPIEENDGLSLATNEENLAQDPGHGSNGAALNLTHESHIGRQKRAAASTALLEHENLVQEIRGCTVGDRKLKIGEALPLDGCGERKCILNGDLLTIIDVRCDTSAVITPENCKLIPNSDENFPECCAVKHLCPKVVEEVFPVIVAPANINQLESNDTDNITESGGDFEESETEAPDQTIFTKRLDPPPISMDLADTRNRKDVVLTGQTPGKPSTEVEGCLLANENRTLKYGETIYLNGCAQMKCISDKDLPVLVVFSCGPVETDRLPEGDCKRVTNQEEKYPECCKATYVCVQTFIFPVLFTAANISQLQIDETDNLINSDHRTFATDDMTITFQTHDETFMKRDPPEEVTVSRQEREITPKTVDNVDECLVGNKTLMVGETIALKECARLTCIPGKTEPLFAIETCDFSSLDPKEGCQIHPSSEQEYPKCCEASVVCTIVVETVVPVVFTAANMSELEKDNQIDSTHDVFMTDDKEIDGSHLSERTTEIKTNHELFSTTRQRREMPLMRTNLSKTSEDCMIGNETLKVGETFPTKGCAQAECVLGANGPFLKVLSCDLFTPPENCFALPPASPEFPKCCVVVFNCTKVVTKVIHVDESFGSVPDVEHNNVELLGGESLIPNPQQYHQTLPLFGEHRNERRRRETTEQPLMEGCVVNDRTMKVGDHIPAKGCARTECVGGANGPYLQTFSCNSFTPPENCFALPPASPEFPKCCVVVFNCTNVIPVDEFLGSVPDVEHNNVELLGGESLIPNPQQYHQTLPLFGEHRNERHRRETTNQLLMEGCVVNDRTMKVGDHIPAKGCARTECVSGANGPYLQTFSCNLPQNTSDGCQALPPASLVFPKCCVRVLVCTIVTTKLVPVYDGLTNLSKLENNEKNDLGLSNPDQNLYQSLGVLKQSGIGETHQPSRRKREANSKTLSVTKERKRDTEECKLGNNTLQKNEVLPLKDCAQVKCTSGEEGLALVVVSCNQTTSNIPQGCSVVSKPEQQYPKCCVVELVCKMVVTKVIPAPNINQLERKEIEDKTNLNSPKFNEERDSQNKSIPAVTMTSSESKPAEETVENTSLNPRGNIRFIPPSSASSNRIKMYDYKEFIERSRRYVKPKANSSSPKPTFILPARKRTNRRRDGASEDPKPDQLALELKHSTLVTVNPTKTSYAEDLRKNEKDSSNKIVRAERTKNRRRLSALLSSRNLRGNASSSEPESEQVKEKSKLKAETKALANEAKSKEKEETPSTEVSSRRQRLRKRYRNVKNRNSDAARSAQRRRIYANRQNRLRITKKPNVKDSQKELTSVGQDAKEEEKTEVKKKEEESAKSSDSDKKENQKTRHKLIRTNFSGKRRRIGRRGKVSETNKPEKDKNKSKRLSVRARTKVVETDREAEDGGKKEEESKKLVVRTKVKGEKEDETDKSSKTKTKPKKRFQRRRKRPLKKNPETSKGNENDESTKMSTKTIQPRPSFTLKTLDPKKVEPKVETSRGRKIFDLSKVKSKEVPKATNRRRVSSRSQLLRQRLKKEKEEKANQENADQRRRNPTKPEPTQILPHPTPYSNEGNFLNTISTPDTYSYYTEPPYIDNFENTLEDFEKLYEFPVVEDDLDLSSSDKDASNSPDTEENEIAEDPEISDVPEPPIKVTTLTFSTSRRSFKSSKTRNTSKNFHKTPNVYGSEETYKAMSYR